MKSGAGLDSNAGLLLCSLPEKCAFSPFLHTFRGGGLTSSLSPGDLCLWSVALPGRRSFIPLDQGQPSAKPYGSPGCHWGHRSSTPAQESLRDWSLRLRPLGLLCFRLSSPGFSSLSHMQDLVSNSLLTLESHLVLGHNTLGMV